ncbi:hypothetical protein JTE90_013088 [Oedothorax gibbosus]|uniref:Protein argonaute-2 n=1 Tax=Oedothorax gibbosus TaxID=931172 RepID=A0AAV6UKP7_9ARAC|nr:hypothetical protein JTE90_013088 [Oedothorax gibbosus]
MAGNTGYFPSLMFPRRPDFGSDGSEIFLQSNLFPIILNNAVVFHYKVMIIPDRKIKQLNRDIVNCIIQTYKNIFGNAVYDGRGNLYLRNPVHMQDSLNLEFYTIFPIDGKNECFTVTFRFIAQLNLGIFNDLLNSFSSIHPYFFAQCIRALSVILRKSPTLKYISIGRSFFSPCYDDNVALGEGREIWFGYFQDTLPSQWKMMLNVDIVASPFHKSLPVVEFLWEVLGKQSRKEKMKPLTDTERQKFAKEMKGLKVEVTHCGTMRRRYKVLNVTKHSVRNQVFEMKLMNGSSFECTVEQYFLDRYKQQPLMYSHLPCLQVGAQPRVIYLPLEVCNVVQGQKCLKKLTDHQTNAMIEATACSAPDRKNDITELVYQNALYEDPFLREFNVNVSTNMIELKGRKLLPPCIKYGGKKQTQVLPNNGVWDMRDKQFHYGVHINVWTIVCFDSPSNCSLASIRNFSKLLRKLSSDAGMTFSKEARHITFPLLDVKRVEPMLYQLKESISELQLILVILPGKTKVYAEIKRMGDTVLGIATQCVKAINVVKPRTQKVSSLCLKINVKLGGVNNILLPRIRPKVFNEPIIILGADIIHSLKSENRRPSVASLVGSMDAHPSRYASSVRVQSRKKQYIQDMSMMLKELMIKFYQITHFKPVRIVLYRNIMTENGLDRLLAQELLAMRHACIMLEPEYKPGITYIALHKRHHTRLFCVNKEDELGTSGNVPPGTTVDSGITHPTNFDFFLCSHPGVQGTSRPCHYLVLWDDNKFKSDELQRLTYQLCYTYARCTRAVSMPAPAYYAHLVAFRSRFHFNDVDMERESEDSVLNSLANAVKLHKNANDGMYFA